MLNFAASKNDLPPTQFMKRIPTLLLLIFMTGISVFAQSRGRNALRETDPAFFQTEEAQRIGDQVILYQRVTGGWPKNIDMSRRLTDDEWELDTNISYAYTDKVLDPCPWGQRTYYNSCSREGGHGDRLNDNLKDAHGHPAYHEITALWTFDGQWDPEQRLRDLWYVLAY